MTRLCLLLSLFPITLYSQKAGIKFERWTNWESQKLRAKNENKYIFIDCYATWCGPCKQMETNVFTDDSLGNLANKFFLSLKVQIDTSTQDDSLTKACYGDAHFIKNKFQISNLPTFLFFSPDGEIIHKGIGSKSVADFSTLLKHAVDTSKQYYRLLANYQSGTINHSLLPYLALTAKKLNEIAISRNVASNYLHNYLDNLSRQYLLTKSNLSFIESFFDVLTSKDEVFRIYYQNQFQIDSITKEVNHSKRFINYLIEKEEVLPLIDFARSHRSIPNWKRIKNQISSKYSKQDANSAIINSKVKWFYTNHKWEQYSNYLIEYVQYFDIDDNLNLNNSAYELFLHSKYKNNLLIALAWVQRALNRDSQSSVILDTKANLLYKLGKRKEALQVEKEALSQDSKDADIQTSYKKMQNGLRTWP